MGLSYGRIESSLGVFFSESLKFESLKFELLDIEGKTYQQTENWNILNRIYVYLEDKVPEGHRRPRIYKMAINIGSTRQY